MRDARAFAFLAGYVIMGLFGVEGFVLDSSTNLQTFQACYAEVLLHIYSHNFGT